MYNNNGIKFKGYIAFFIAFIIMFSSLNIPTFAAVSSTEYTITFTSNDTDRFQELFDSNMFFSGAIEGSRKEEGKYTYPILYERNFLTTQLRYDTEELGLASIQIICGEADKTISIAEFPSSATYLEGVGKPGSEGIRYWNTGTALQVQVFKWIPTDNITIKYNFAVDESEFSIKGVFSSDESKGTVREVSLGANENEFILSATPQPGYMLDYWEWTSIEDDWDNATKIHNDSYENNKSTITETITEDRWYRAEFKEWQFLMPGDAAIVNLSEKLANNWSYLEDLKGRVSWVGNPMPLTESIRAGKPAILHLLFNFPSTVNLGSGEAKLSLFAGDATSDPTAEAFVDNWYIPNLKGLHTTKPLSKAFLYVEALPNVEGITVEIKTADGSVATRKYYPLTIEMDSSAEYREEKLTALKQYYRDNFAEEPLDKINPNTGHQDFSRIESEREKYNSLAAVRYLLRFAYEDAVKAIKHEATDKDDIDEKYDDAIELFKGYITLNNDIKAGNGDKAYSEVKGIKIQRVLVYLNPSVDLPSFAYIPDDTVVRDALEASMENYSPGKWVIKGGGFITDIGTTYGNGKVEPGGNSSQIVYAQNHKWAIGIASQTMTDKDVLNFGQSIVINAYPLLEKVPDKTELIWAIGTLNEKIQAGQLNTSEAFDNAMKIARLWNVAFYDGKATGVNSHTTGTELAKAQEAVDNALAELQAAYPNVNLLRLDLPEDVLAVMKLINNIGSITPGSKEAIQAARTAYNALDENNKALVPNYATLVAAEEAYELLTSVPTEAHGIVLEDSLNNLKSSYSTNPATGSIGGEWSVLGIARGDKSNTDIENKYLGQLNALLVDKGLDGLGASKYTEYSRITLALSALGIDAQNYSYAGKNYDFTSKLLDYNNVIKQGINGPIFALLALDAKPYMPGNTAIRDSYIDYILARQHNDGGWALEDSKTDPSDPDITAMVLQALANYRGISKVDTAINGGLNALKSMQDKTHGGFYNSDRQYNSESASQVIVALTSLGIDPTASNWTVGDGKTPVTAQLTFYDSKTKMFKHSLNGSSDIMATEQAVYALVALDRYNKSAKSLYDMSDAFDDELPGEDKVNKAGLRDALVTASRLREEDYTSESWQLLADKLVEAERVRDKSDATQEEVDDARIQLLNAIGGLKFAEITINKALLNAAIAIGDGLDGDDYSNWLDVSNALSTAKAIEADADQSEVDEAAKDLLDALLELKLLPQTELLNAAVNNTEDESLSESDYTASTWAAYNNARTEALTVIDAVYGVEEQSEINSAAQDLISSIGNLELEDESTTSGAIELVLEGIRDDLTEEKYSSSTWANLDSADGIQALVNALLNLELTDELDYGVLELFIEEADKLREDDYTETSYGGLEEALSVKLKIGQNVYNRQEEIDTDAAAILTAMKGLEISKQAGESNKVLLKSLIDNADSLQESRYTKESWSELKAALNDAKDLYNDPHASQEEIDDAKDNLLSAIGKLETTSSETILDKTELSYEIDEASKISNTGKAYTTASWASFENALRYAQAVLKDDKASQIEINNASRDLRIAIAGLTEYKDDGTGEKLPDTPTETYATISVMDPNARSGQTRTYFPRTEMELREGETAYSILQRTGLRLRVSSHPVYSGVYVEAIEGFGEFDDGPLSGWMYMVNGHFPDYSASLYELRDGDEVEWVYTRDLGKDVGSTWEEAKPVPDADRTIEPDVTIRDNKGSVSINLDDLKDAINKAKENDDAIIIIPKVTKEVKTMEVSLEKDALREIVRQTKSPLIIETPIGHANIPNAALESIVSQAAGSTITLVIQVVEEKVLTPLQEETLAKSDIFDISIISGGKAITSFNGKTIGISLPYTLKANEKAEDVKVWHLNDAKELEKMTSNYSEKTKLATFNTSHLSYYLVGVEGETKKEEIVEFTMNFTDVKESDWFYKAVKFAVENGLFKGTSESTFGPNESMTRAMLVTVLHRMEGLSETLGVNKFTDVKDKEWYTDAILWANANGIVSGYGDGRFGTNDPITREQMAVVLYNYASYKGYDISAIADLTSYADAVEISSWAKDSMGWANANKLITGRSATSLAAKGTATRAEVASILQRFMENFIK